MSPDVDPDEAFAAVDDPIRAGILRALAERRRDHPEDPGMAFTELRERVGVRDPGRFDRHLERVEGTFLAHEGDRYYLNYAGRELVGALFAGAHPDREADGPVELDAACGLCEAPVAAEYDEGVLRVVCGNDHPQFVWELPPGATRGSLSEVVDVATRLARQHVELARSGVCLRCYGPMETRIETGDRAAGTTARFVAACESCGSRLNGPVGFCLLDHPEVRALYARHDRPVDDHHLWELGFTSPTAVTVLGADPPRVRVTVQVGDDRLDVALDERARVVDTRREG